MLLWMVLKSLLCVIRWIYAAAFRFLMYLVVILSARLQLLDLSESILHQLISQLILILQTLVELPTYLKKKYEQFSVIV